MSDKYYAGKGCRCCASSVFECGCEGVDWTDPDIYMLRDENAALKIERNRYKIALQDIAEASGGWAKRRAQIALKKENQS